ncbi:MAG: peptidoglycan-binding domain-containing protein [Pseudomonadota bacterium]
MRFDNQHEAIEYELDDEDLVEPLWLSLCRSNPGTTAATVITGTAFAIFAVNALFLQSHKHPSAWFETRAYQSSDELKPDERLVGSTAPEKDVTRILIDPQTTALIKPPAERPEQTVQYVQMPTVERVVPELNDELPNQLAEVQKLLSTMGFYDGKIDGLTGPMTRSAIEAYKVSAGLSGVAMTEDQLLNNVRRSSAVLAAIPRQEMPTPALPEPTLRPNETAPEDIAQRLGPSARDERVRRVQAGLKAFGNNSISIDGVFGSQTRASIREFQALFELPVTGEIDDQLVYKMVTIGLID